MAGNSCLLCFETIKNVVKDNDNIADIFQCCDRFLCENIKGDSFRWNFSTDNNVPFCLRCLDSSKKMWLLEKKLKEISQELENYIVTFTEEIIIFRTERQGRDDQAATDQCNEAILGIPFHQADPDDVDFETQSQDIPIDTILVSPQKKYTDESAVVIEVFKQEPERAWVADVDNHFDDLGLSSPIASPLPDADIAVDEPIFVPEIPSEQDGGLKFKEIRVSLERLDSNVLLKDYCKNWQNGTYPELRVSIQRLIFDCDGKPILNYYKPIKRKAAIVAAVTLRNKSEKQDVKRFTKNKRGRNHPSVAKDDDLWNYSDADANDYSDEEIEEMGPSRSKKRKCQTRKSRKKEPLQCVVCSVQFKLATKLDEHSAATGHANERKFQCNSCPNKYFRKCDLKYHRKSHNYKGKNCRICGEFLETILIYRSHHSNHRNSEKRKRGEKIKWSEKKIPKFSCVVCQMNFPFSKELDAHSEETGHVNERQFQCKICPNKYYRKVDLKSHNLLHNYIPKPCSFCGKECLTYTSLKFHARMHNKQSPGSVKREKPGRKTTKMRAEKFECIVCSAEFPSAKELSSHSEELGHANARTFECEQCPRKYYRYCDLRGHRKSHNATSKTCSICGYVLGTSQAYKRHFERKHKGHDLSANEGFESHQFKCLICEKHFAKESDYNGHCNFHIGATPYKCDQCLAAYGHKTSLAEHLKAHKMNYVQCTICWELFKNEVTLNYHGKSHENETRTKCDSCERTFTEKKHLIAHGIAEHGKETPFKCELCEASFNYRKDFALHMKLKHPREFEAKGIKAYECDSCEMMFNTRCTLRYHVAIVHKNDLSVRKKKNPRKKSGVFPCEHCDNKIFSTRQALNEHVKVLHLKILSFVCHICGKNLSSASALTAHLKIHTDVTLDCPICGRGFSERWNLKTHIKRIHEENKRPRKSYRRTPAAVAKQATHMEFPPNNTQQPDYSNIGFSNISF